MLDRCRVAHPLIACPSPEGPVPRSPLWCPRRPRPKRLRPNPITLPSDRPPAALPVRVRRRYASGRVGAADVRRRRGSPCRPGPPRARARPGDGVLRPERAAGTAGIPGAGVAGYRASGCPLGRGQGQRRGPALALPRRGGRGCSPPVAIGGARPGGRDQRWRRRLHRFPEPGGTPTGRARGPGGHRRCGRLLHLGAARRTAPCRPGRRRAPGRARRGRRVHARQRLGPGGPGRRDHMLASWRRPPDAGRGGRRVGDPAFVIPACRCAPSSGQLMSAAGGSALSSGLRRYGQLGRLGGEEFAAVLPRTGLAEAARRGRSPSRYLELFRSAREQLLSEGAVPDHVLLDTTWQVSLDQLQQDDAAAVQLLRHVAFLAADPFPVAVLADQEPTILPGPLHEVLADPVRRDRTLGALHRYALVRRDGDSIQMHRLVQAAVRRSLPPPERATVEGTVLRLLQAALPQDILDQPDAWPRWRQLLPHVLVACAERPDQC